ncbi:MAG: diguanylate cyclase [Lautropia sp.]
MPPLRFLLPFVFLIALLQAFVPQAARAQPAIVLDDARAEVPAWPAIRVMADPAHAMDIDDAQRRLGDFEAPRTPVDNLGPRPETIWLHVPVQVATGDGRWILDIDYPTLQRADVYLVSGGKVVLERRLGSELAYGRRPMASRTHAIELALAPPARYDIFLRVRTSTSMVLPIRLSKPARYHSREAAMQMRQGVMIGIALALLAYSVAHWLTLRNALFGLYAVMLVGSTTFFLVFFGIGQQYLWHETTTLVAKLAPLSVLVAIPAGGLFVARAAETAAERPWLHRGLIAVSGASVLAFVLSIVGVLDYHRTQVAATALGPMLPMLALPAAWHLARRGERAGIFMLIGWSSYTVGALTMAALLRGLLPANAWTQQMFQWGTLVEMLAWLQVLGLHIEALRRNAERTEQERAAWVSLAQTDSLTGLRNRRGLMQALEAMLEDAAPGRVAAVFMLDLDGFKAVNDRFGHESGDALLVEVAARLKRQLRQSDVVARLGGDEFVVVAGGLRNGDEAQAIGRKLLAAIDPPFLVDGERCSVGVTIGLSISPNDGRAAAALLKLADAAMYVGKQAGKHTIRRSSVAIGAPA